jgi:parvulin-like peptidyl-prolyl isomerase
MSMHGARHKAHGAKDAGQGTGEAMKRSSTILVSAITIMLVGLSGPLAAAQDLPVVKGKKIVASVNGAPITLDEFNREVASMKSELAPGQQVDRRAELDLLKRLINTRLIVLEAKQIGLDKLPEVMKMVDAFSKETLRGELAEKITKGIKADDKEVETVYRQSMQEWKINAILCEKEEDAKTMEKEVTAGRDFGELANAFVAEGRAKRGEEGVYLKVKDVDPQIGKVVSSMVVGSTSPIIHTKSGFVILRLEDIRYSESPEEQEDARRIALAMTRGKALKAYDDALRKKYVKVNRDLLKRVDYESETPGFDALLKDTRVIADVRGEKPVTVADLTEEIRFHFFHGVQGAAERKKINARKETILDGMIHKKVFRKEALRLGLDKTDSYRGKVREYENGVVFGAFIRKVIVPDLKITEDEAKAFYNNHLKEYATPEMMKIQSLVFGKRKDAESAIERLKGGAEFQWVADHAEGQVDQNAKGILSFDGGPIIIEELPEGVRKAIAGAKAGDSRLYASAEGHFYMLAVQEVFPSKSQPYEQARQEIAKQLFNEKQKKAVEQYADRLRSLSKVQVYLKG